MFTLIQTLNENGRHNHFNGIEPFTYLSDELKFDKNFVLKLLSEEGNGLSIYPFLPQILKEDKDIILTGLRSGHICVSEVSSLILM